MVLKRGVNRFLFLWIVSGLMLSNPTISHVTVPTTTHAQSSGTTDILFECSQTDSPIYQRETIFSVDDPIYISVEEANSQILDDDLVIGVVVDGQARVYPHAILRYHEIINDQTSSTFLAATYCPLTGSAIVYPTAQLGFSTVGVTGVLFESNLVFYDRETDSCFAQMLSLGMSGERLGQLLNYEAIIETNWATWKAMYPSSIVVSDDTGYNRDYARNPFSGYETESSILHETSNSNEAPYNLYHTKEKTLILVENSLEFLFPFEELAKESITNLNLEGNPYVIFYDANYNYAIPYSSKLNDENLIFNRVSGDINLDTDKTLGLPVYRDQLGNVWNVKGEAIDGPNLGQILERKANFNAYWFAASVFFPDANIYTNGDFANYDVTPQADELFVPEDSLGTIDIIIISFFIAMPILVLIITKLKERSS